MTRVGFEPTPFRTAALTQRLRPLGHLAYEWSREGRQTGTLAAKREVVLGIEPRSPDSESEVLTTTPYNHSTFRRMTRFSKSRPRVRSYRDSNPGRQIQSLEC